MDFSIKKLKAADLESAKELWLLWRVDEGYKDPSLPVDGYLTSLLLRDNFHVLAAFYNDKVIGGLTAYEMIMYQQQETELFIYEIGVEPEYRRKGIASALLNQLKKYGLEKGISVMYVGTEMDNGPAKELYSATGGRFEGIAWYTYE